MMKTTRLCLYYKNEPECDRWFHGDRYLRPVIRRILRGKPRAGGVDKVFLNLCKGLNNTGIKYTINLPFNKLKDTDQVAVLGRGRACLNGYNKPNPIVAGIGLMTHPSEWPTLCSDYPVVRYLQHSLWCDAVYRPYFGTHCRVWPVGIDTTLWAPSQTVPKSIDFLLYNKIHWNNTELELSLLEPIRNELRKNGLHFLEIKYGHYHPAEFKGLLAKAKAMIFLCEHESQGIAAQEAMSSGVPLFAWDCGYVCDPQRSRWGQSVIPATSVPYFDNRCGIKFSNFDQFRLQLPQFVTLQRSGKFTPRDYITENLTLEKQALEFVDIVAEAYRDPESYS